MRYRKLDAQGDYTFGGGQADFYINQPEAPAQAVLTRLRLDLGAWFLDTTDGTNWKTGVLGNNTSSTRDAIIRDRILSTPGVTSIIDYNSRLDSNTRKFNVAVRIQTVYGTIPSSASANTNFINTFGAGQHNPNPDPPVQEGGPGGGVIQNFLVFTLDIEGLDILDSSANVLG